jgi:hypothetical protein
MALIEASRAMVRFASSFRRHPLAEFADEVWSPSWRWCPTGSRALALAVGLIARTYNNMVPTDRLLLPALTHI